MKKFIFGFLLIGLISCEEVIEIDLNEADPRLVIEGQIVNTGGPFRVNVAQTTNFFGSATSQPVDVQQIMLTTSEGQEEDLVRVSDGTYEIRDTEGTPLETYTLTVWHEGSEFTTTSTMPAPIEIDRIQAVFDERAFNPAGESGYEVTCYFNDPAREENFYRLEIYQNGDRLTDTGFYLFDDKFSDGNEIGYAFFDRRFQLGDTIKVELQSMDEPTYRYYEQLNDIVETGGPNGTAAPGNPTSVFSADALGVFAAYARNTMEFSIIIE
ncbi:MAG: DUF4249 domain-containing protein [Bacteroidota bacterium]